jgi:hypothetical protein
MSAPRWEWKLPHGADDAAQPRLQLFNSYQNRTVPFVPAAGPQSRQISWYTCGPTVYEVRHEAATTAPVCSRQPWHPLLAQVFIKPCTCTPAVNCAHFIATQLRHTIQMPCARRSPTWAMPATT